MGQDIILTRSQGTCTVVIKPILHFNPSHCYSNIVLLCALHFWRRALCTVAIQTPWSIDTHIFKRFAFAQTLKFALIEFHAQLHILAAVVADKVVMCRAYRRKIYYSTHLINRGSYNYG